MCRRGRLRYRWARSAILKTGWAGAGRAHPRRRQHAPHRRRRQKCVIAVARRSPGTQIPSGSRRKMSPKSGTPKKNLMLFSGRAYRELAEEVAQHLNVTITPQTAHTFANGELFVRFEESVRGTDAFVIQSHTDPINEWVMEQLIMVDALKRASAKRITVVMPFYPYARQDKKHKGREPISARLIADLFKTAGADRIMTVDLHTAQIQGFFDGPVDHLWAMALLAEHVRDAYGDGEITVVSPDAG